MIPKLSPIPSSEYSTVEGAWGIPFFPARDSIRSAHARPADRGNSDDFSMAPNGIRKAASNSLTTKCCRAGETLDRQNSIKKGKIQTVRPSPRFVLIAVLVGFGCLAWPKHSFAQVVEAARMSNIHLKAGAGMDYWDTDYGGRWKFGPAAWAGAELWRGFGLQVEGHSLVGGGGNLTEYKYYVGEGGIVYTLHRWNKIEPFAKAEVGFGGLSFPRPTSISHDTRTTWIRRRSGIPKHATIMD